MWYKIVDFWRIPSPEHARRDALVREPRILLVDRLRVSSGEVSRGEKMLYARTDPESCITDDSLVYEY